MIVILFGGFLVDRRSFSDSQYLNQNSKAAADEKDTGASCAKRVSKPDQLVGPRGCAGRYPREKAITSDGPGTGSVTPDKKPGHGNRGRVGSRSGGRGAQGRSVRPIR